MKLLLLTAMHISLPRCCPADTSAGPQTAHIVRRAPVLLEDAALRTLLLGAVLLDTGNLTGQSVRGASAERRSSRLLCSASCTHLSVC